jgi:metacaspase-1
MKKALLVGINYIRTPYQLNGCINDINNIGSYLFTARKYNSFIVMTDYSPVKPTRSNILAGFNALLRGAVAGDELWFHFSGHGSLTRDTNGDEESGNDSCICPIDFNKSGFITDDIIRNNLALLVPKGVRLYIVIDACHSGTSCDLRYKYDDSSYLTNKSSQIPTKYIPNDWSLQQTNYEFKKYNKTNGEVFCISGCQDHQTSADAYMEGKAAGVLTYLLLTCLRNNSPTTYKWKHLLKDICCGEKVCNFEQRTCITSGNALNLEDTVFVLQTPTRLTRSAPITSAPSPPSAANIIKRSFVNILPSNNKTNKTIHNLNYIPKIKKLYISY